MKNLLICMLLLTCSVVAAPRERPQAPKLGLHRILLNSGEVISAPLIYSDQQRVIISFNGDILSLNKSAIAEMIDEKKIQATSTRPVGGTLYHIGDDNNLGSLEMMVEKTQSAVLTVQTPRGQGSGFFINAKGYLVTNVHVVEGESLITVRQHQQMNGQRGRQIYENVKIVSIAPFYDLALLKVETDQEVPFVPILRGSTLQRGVPLFAIGNPMGLERSVSSGIASVVDRTFGGIRYIQTTVQVNPGNSGGPLFNLAGEVVGVINMKMMQSEGLGFAIPTFYLKDFLDNYTSYLYDSKSPNAGIHYLVPPELHF